MKKAILLSLLVMGCAESIPLDFDGGVDSNTDTLEAIAMDIPCPTSGPDCSNAGVQICPQGKYVFQCVGMNLILHSDQTTTCMSGPPPVANAAFCLLP